MWGISPYYVRVLCDNPWEGGKGYTPNEVGSMTLDQIFALLVERKLLRSRGKRRTTRMPSLQAKIDDNGFARGRAADGTPIRARIGGKSAAQLAREREAIKAETPRQRRSRERAVRAEQRRLKAEQRKPNGT